MATAVGGAECAERGVNGALGSSCGVLGEGEAETARGWGRAGRGGSADGERSGCVELARSSSTVEALQSRASERARGERTSEPRVCRDACRGPGRGRRLVRRAHTALEQAAHARTTLSRRQYSLVPCLNDMSSVQGRLQLLPAALLARSLLDRLVVVGERRPLGLFGLARREQDIVLVEVRVGPVLEAELPCAGVVRHELGVDDERRLDAKDGVAAEKERDGLVEEGREATRKARRSEKTMGRRVSQLDQRAREEAEQARRGRTCSSTGRP